jgi:hypothetical protein
MTYGEIKTRIMARLRDGTGRAMSADEKSCVYRTADGCGCAVGCLIPEEHYDPAIEERTVGAAVAVGDDGWLARDNTSGNVHLAAVLNASGIPATEDVFNLLRRAQTLHDGTHNWDGPTYIGPEL